MDLQNESKTFQKRPCLGPAVETDDEVNMATPAPTRNVVKRHRRTASDSGNTPEHLGLGLTSSKQHIPRRPDSAGSTPESTISSTPAIPEVTSARDSISSVAHNVTEQVTALSQAIVAPESLSQKEGSDSSSKSCGSDTTATLKQTQLSERGRVGGMFKIVPTIARMKEQPLSAEQSKVLRTDSMSSSTSTAAVSRDTSFSRYDGSESSPQSLSHESLEVTNHLVYPSATWFQAICPSSSDDDVRTSGRGRLVRDRNACETPHVKGERCVGGLTAIRDVCVGVGWGCGGVPAKMCQCVCI